MNVKSGTVPLQHTLNHKECPACIRANDLATRKHSMSVLGLREAGEVWLSQKEWKRRKPRTLEAARCYLHDLVEFFGPEMKLDHFTPGSLLAFQTERSKTAGASYVNHETNALSQMLKMAGLWEKIKPYFSPLPEPEWQKPKIFTAEEEQRIFDYAKDDPNVELAEIVFSITRFSGICGSELRLSRIRQLDLLSSPCRFQVTGDTTKNTIRPRIVPLIPEAEEMFRRAINRAARLGSHMPHHFIFPLRVNRALWNPNKPASRSWLRCQTKKLREYTGVEHLKPHLWRHQAVTEVLEQGKSAETVKSIFGWCSEKMFETYCHTRVEAKMDALDALRRRGDTEIEKTIQQWRESEATMRNMGYLKGADEIARLIAALQKKPVQPEPRKLPSGKIISFHR